MTLTADQRERYRLNTCVAALGQAGQERLAKSRVLIVGLGGLGSPNALYLAAAGVGVLGLVDPDVVNLSNLQRQILYRTEHIGVPKAEAAAEALRALNPGVEVTAHRTSFDAVEGPDLAREYDLIVEATDNFEAKYAINDICLSQRKPWVTAGILAMAGQAMLVAPGATACLRCIVPTPPVNAPSTHTRGVLGPVAGMLGSLQALEALRWLAGIWKPQPEGQGLLHSIDGETMHCRTLRIPRRPDCVCAAVRK